MPVDRMLIEGRGDKIGSFRHLAFFGEYVAGCDDDVLIAFTAARPFPKYHPSRECRLGQERPIVAVREPLW